MEKSFVSLEQRICVCCGKAFDTDSLLLDRRLKDSMEHHTVTGYALCKDCTKEGYVLMIVIDNDPSTREADGMLNPSEANRTGATIHMRNKVFQELFHQEPVPVVYIDQKLFERLADMYEKAPKEEKI